MRVIGIDPPTAWALLEMRPGTLRPLFVAAGQEKDWLGIPWASSGVGLVAVEDARFFFPSDARRHTEGRRLAARADQLWIVQKLGQRILGMAMERGIATIEITSAAWRQVLGVRVGGRIATPPVVKRPTVDAEVELALLTRVEGWPARSNAHVRDAAGVAIGGFERWLREGRRTAG